MNPVRRLQATDSIESLTALLHRAYARLGRIGLNYTAGTIGAMRLQRAEEWAAEHRFAELAMDTAEPATHLVALYERLGYARVGTVQWPGKVYRSVVMSKRLAAR